MGKRVRGRRIEGVMRNEASIGLTAKKAEKTDLIRNLDRKQKDMQSLIQRIPDIAPMLRSDKCFHKQFVTQLKHSSVAQDS